MGRIAASFLSLGQLARRIAYWTLLTWLVLFACLLVGEIVSCLEDWDTYRRVYDDPALYYSVIWVAAALHWIGAATQAIGWRSARTSWIAVMAAGLFAGFLVVNSIFRIVAICCG